MGHLPRMKTLPYLYLSFEIGRTLVRLRVVSLPFSPSCMTLKKMHDAHDAHDAKGNRERKMAVGAARVARVLPPGFHAPVFFSRFFFAPSLRSQRFDGVGEQRKTEERDFRCLARAKNGAVESQNKKVGVAPFFVSDSLHGNANYAGYFASRTTD